MQKWIDNKKKTKTKVANSSRLRVPQRDTTAFDVFRSEYLSEQGKSIMIWM